ncbi:transposable element Tcb1 transposase [Trichonephila clavipes]|nr:transposable element Tcb1 transposase [Trichonephila clavipes]
MDDNARPHHANIVDECLQSEDITRMDWPANSPDLNPIEHVWDMLDRRIAARQPPPTCLPELRRALLNEWCNIPHDQIDNLILSMPRRCIALSGRQYSAGRRTGQVDHSECAVRNCWEQWTREGAHARKTGSGTTRKTTRREDRRIVRQALVDLTVTRSTIRADAEIVPQTISRHLAEANLKSKHLSVHSL